MSRVRDCHGLYVLCAWDDCPKPGRTEYGWQQPKDRHATGPIYLFCSEVHRAFYVHAPIDLHNLPTGSRGSLAG